MAVHTHARGRGEMLQPPSRAPRARGLPGQPPQPSALRGWAAPRAAADACLQQMGTGAGRLPSPRSRAPRGQQTA